MLSMAFCRRYIYAFGKTFNKGKSQALLSTNCDLFKEIFTLISTRQLVVTVRWMPSHLKEDEERPLGVSLEDVKANALADVQAGLAAKYHAVPLNVSAPYIYYFGLIRKIQRRLVDIIVSLPHRSRIAKPKTPTPFHKETIEDLMHSSKHIPFFSGTNISCARCFDKVPASGPCTRSWLQGLCQKMYTPEDRPVPLHYNHVQLAHHTAHVTHIL